MDILFNADDFGLTKGVTDGIIKAHKEGVVGATTIMMNGKATKYAVEKARHYPTLNVGLHLVLTWGKPLSKNVQGLINPQGHFKLKNTYLEMEPPHLDDVRKEWTAQIEAFLATGLPLHHIDSHHHIHGWGPLKEIVIELARKYNTPVRYVDSLKNERDLLLTDTLWKDFYGENVSSDIFQQLKALQVPSVEVMTHPAFIDSDLKEVSSYLEKREEELSILCNLEVPKWANIL